jgi:histidine decarboxylase
MNTPRFHPTVNLANALSPYDQYCDGYGNPGASGGSYLLGFVLGVASAPVTLAHEGSQVLDEINAFDRAEVESAYIGQINMSIVSSFCGPHGLIWGYDLVKPTPLNVVHPLAPAHVGSNGMTVPVFSLEPLLAATTALFGTVGARRFPLLPGAHVPCAGKNKKSLGPKYLYATLGVGIPQDRSQAACLLMEDMGYLPVGTDDAGDLDHHRRIVLTNMVKSIVEISHNQWVAFREIFVGMKDILVPKGDIGCALVAAPYFTLARRAIPQNEPARLLACSLQEWEDSIR